MCTFGYFSATTSWSKLWAAYLEYQLHAAPTACTMKDQMLFLALFCSACGFATQFCIISKTGFPVKVSIEQF